MSVRVAGRDTVSADQISRLSAGGVLVQDRDDLLGRETGLRAFPIHPYTEAGTSCI